MAGMFDGRWIDEGGDVEKITTIKDGKIFWYDGLVTDVVVHDTDKLVTYVPGHLTLMSFRAVLDNSERLIWDFGGVWALHDPQKRGAQNARQRLAAEKKEKSLAEEKRRAEEERRLADQRVVEARQSAEAKLAEEKCLAAIRLAERHAEEKRLAEVKREKAQAKREADARCAEQTCLAEAEAKLVAEEQKCIFEMQRPQATLEEGMLLEKGLLLEEELLEQVAEGMQKAEGESASAEVQELELQRLAKETIPAANKNEDLLRQILFPQSINRYAMAHS